MEDLDLTQLFNGCYRDQSVVVTGHTGFKGSWLALWLQELGARVTGFALEPNTHPSHFELLKLNCKNEIGDIRDQENCKDILARSEPSIVFHLAAQSLVRHSYLQPHETFVTNAIGTLNVLEAVRTLPSVRAVVVVTSDKCYLPKSNNIPHVESDPLGGCDPYSASKACAELITASYQRAYFCGSAKEVPLVASTRAGNVIGGGDWSVDRLVPDICRSAATGTTCIIRNPKHVRPWQHVLECLCGYLLLGERLLKGECDFVGSWNFGSNAEDQTSVEVVAKKFAQKWSNFTYISQASAEDLGETPVLKLDSAKSIEKLGWRPIWDLDTALSETVDWYRTYYESGTLLSKKQLKRFAMNAKHLGLFG